MLCLFGFCIPYTLLWPLALLVCKNIWSFFFNNKRVGEKPLISQAKAIDSKNSSTNIQPESENSSAISLSKDMDWNQIKSSKRPTIVRFTAVWCKACKEVAELFLELSKQHSKDASFYIIDVDEFDELAAECLALSIPMIIAFREGKIIGRQMGKNEESIRTFIKDCFNK